MDSFTNLRKVSPSSSTLESRENTLLKRSLNADQAACSWTRTTPSGNVTSAVKATEEKHFQRSGKWKSFQATTAPCLGKIEMRIMYAIMCKLTLPRLFGLHHLKLDLSQDQTIFIIRSKITFRAPFWFSDTFMCLLWACSMFTEWNPRAHYLLKRVKLSITVWPWLPYIYKSIDL